MSKENIFSKLNIKDYNNELEKILSKKDFSLDTRNLLLSMLYKIENSYNDYYKVKQDVLSKSKYMEKIINIIDTKCYEFITIKPQMSEFEEMKNIKYIIDKDKGKITVIENEFYALKAIMELPKIESCISNEYNLLKLPICNMLSVGSVTNEVEVLRDFNGWSWNVNINAIDNIKVNLVYQNLVYLLGNVFLTNWTENKEEMADYLMLAKSKLEEENGEEFAKNVINLTCKISMELFMNKNILDETAKMKEELNLFSKREEYLEKTTDKKKKYIMQIENIDKTINNQELLQKEYVKRNLILENKDKIFSIKRLKIIMGEEREGLLKKIKEANDLIDPKKYVERKTKVEETYSFLKDLNLDGIDQNKIIELCNYTLKAFKIRVEKAQTREELLTLVYEIRYYRYILANEEKTIKDLKELSIPFYKVMIKLLRKLIDFKWAEQISNFVSINLRALINVFDSKIIDLDNLVIETEYEKNRIKVKYYDTNILENEYIIELNSPNNQVNVNRIKLKKKIKAFN